MSRGDVVDEVRHRRKADGVVALELVDLVLHVMCASGLFSANLRLAEAHPPTLLDMGGLSYSTYLHMHAWLLLLWNHHATAYVIQVLIDMV